MGREQVSEVAPAHVLIVDDNLAYAENLAEILELSGCPSEVFATAEEALPAALGPDANAVITDFRLPGMNGIELLAQIIRARGALPAIVISAYADDGVVEAARALGAEYHAKPVALPLIERFVRDLRPHA